jgi:hypothetical protein
MVADEEQAALLAEWDVHAQSVFMGVLVVGMGVLACESVRESWGCGEMVLTVWYRPFPHYHLSWKWRDKDGDGGVYED